MKKNILFAATLSFILFGCNDHQSANPNIKEDASNSTIDETGPARNAESDTGKTPRHENLNDGSKDSTGTKSNAQKPGTDNGGSNIR
jgi:hypothetical protein